jgi:hypothetical protein
MDVISHFDLSLSSDGKVYDISFHREEIKKNTELTQICENPLIEQCEEEEEKKIIFNHDDSEEEEDTSIIKIYDGIKYLTFPGNTSIYTVKSLRYAGSIDEEGKLTLR